MEQVQDAEKYRVVEGIDMAKVRPMKHHIIVRWLASKETKGGLILPQNRQRKNRMNGVILAVGPKCEPEIVEAFENGYRIVFDALSEKEWIGSQDPSDRDTVFIMREEDVLMTLEVVEANAGEVVASGMETPSWM